MPARRTLKTNGHGPRRRKMKKTMMVVVAAMMLVGTKAFAVNPANVVGLYERFDVTYISAHYCPGGARMGFVNVPTSSTTNLGITQWNSKDGSMKDLELDFAASIGNRIEASFYTVAFQANNQTTFTHTLGLKYAKGNGSAGVVLPFTKGDATKLGASWSHKSITLYSTLTLDSNMAPVVGISYKGKLATIEIARTDNGTNFVRISKGFSTKSGTFKPEIRIQNERVGLTLGFFPK